MAEITSVEQQKRDKNRCNIYVDGCFYCGVKTEIAVKYHLKAGVHIEKSRLDEIQLETEKSQALDKAMTHISVSMKTEKKIVEFLEKKGYTDAVCGYVVDKLKYYGLLDDFAYCRAYVNNVKGKGKRALYADLIKRGAEREAIESALEDVEEDGDEALVILKKYMRGKVCDRQNLSKGLKYLLSKGYGYDTAKSAVALMGEGEEDEDY